MVVVGMLYIPDSYDPKLDPSIRYDGFATHQNYRERFDPIGASNEDDDHGGADRDDKKLCPFAPSSPNRTRSLSTTGVVMSRDSGDDRADHDGLADYVAAVRALYHTSSDEGEPLNPRVPETFPRPKFWVGDGSPDPAVNNCLGGLSPNHWHRYRSKKRRRKASIKPVQNRHSENGALSAPPTSFSFPKMSAYDRGDGRSLAISSDSADERELNNANNLNSSGAGGGGVISRSIASWDLKGTLKRRVPPPALNIDPSFDPGSELPKWHPKSVRGHERSKSFDLTNNQFTLPKVGPEQTTGNNSMPTFKKGTKSRPALVTTNFSCQPAREDKEDTITMTIKTRNDRESCSPDEELDFGVLNREVTIDKYRPKGSIRKEQPFPLTFLNRTPSHVIVVTREADLYSRHQRTPPCLKREPNNLTELINNSHLEPDANEQLTNGHLAREPNSDIGRNRVAKKVIDKAHPYANGVESSSSHWWPMVSDRRHFERMGRNNPRYETTVHGMDQSNPLANLKGNNEKVRGDGAIGRNFLEGTVAHHVSYTQPESRTKRIEPSFDQHPSPSNPIASTVFSSLKARTRLQHSSDRRHFHTLCPFPTYSAFQVADRDNESRRGTWIIPPNPTPPHKIDPLDLKSIFDSLDSVIQESLDTIVGTSSSPSSSNSPRDDRLRYNGSIRGNPSLSLDPNSAPVIRSHSVRIYDNTSPSSTYVVDSYTSPITYPRRSLQNMGTELPSEGYSRIQNQRSSLPWVGSIAMRPVKLQRAITPALSLWHEIQSKTPLKHVTDANVRTIEEEFGSNGMSESQEQSFNWSLGVSTHPRHKLCQTRATIHDTSFSHPKPGYTPTTLKISSRGPTSPHNTIPTPPRYPTFSALPGSLYKTDYHSNPIITANMSSTSSVASHATSLPKHLTPQTLSDNPWRKKSKPTTWYSEYASHTLMCKGRRPPPRFPHFPFSTLPLPGTSNERATAVKGQISEADKEFWVDTRGERRENFAVGIEANCMKDDSTTPFRDRNRVDFFEPSEACLAVSTGNGCQGNWADASILPKHDSAGSAIKKRSRLSVSISLLPPFSGSRTLTYGTTGSTTTADHKRFNRNANGCDHSLVRDCEPHRKNETSSLVRYISGVRVLPTLTKIPPPSPVTGDLRSIISDLGRKVENASLSLGSIVR